MKIKCVRWSVGPLVRWFVPIFLLIPATAEAEIIDRIVAVVNDEVITELDLSRALAKDRESVNVVEKEINKSKTLDGLIDDALLRQIMDKSKMEVTDDDLARAIASILHRNGITLDQLRAEIASKGMTYDEYKEQVENEVRRAKFVNQVIGPQVKITDQDLRDYFQRHQEQFRGSHQAHIAEIILPLAGATTQAEFEDIRDTALAISNKAKAGTSFEKLLEQYSGGAHPAQGGDLGMINLKDISPEISGTIRFLKPGEVSSPILTRDAVVIIKFVSLPELSALDFERMRDDIYAVLYEERIGETLRAYLSRERQKAFIEVR